MNRATILYGLVILTFAAVDGAQTESTGDPAKYLAFRPPSALTVPQYEKIVKSLASLDVKTLHNHSLDYHKIIVFELPQAPRTLKKARKVVSRLMPIPVQNYRGVLSVASGRMYVQFKDEVPIEEANARLLGAGFRVLTSPLEPRSLIAVDKTRLPKQRQSEIQVLQGLPDLLYVAPDDIPLPVRPPPYRGNRPDPQP